MITYILKKSAQSTHGKSSNSYAQSLEKDYDLLHSFLPDSALLGPFIFKRFNYQIIVSKRDLLLSEKKILYALCTRFMKSQVDRYLCNSHAIKQKLLTLNIKQNVFVLPQFTL